MLSKTSTTFAGLTATCVATIACGSAARLGIANDGGVADSQSTGGDTGVAAADGKASDAGVEADAPDDVHSEDLHSASCNPPLSAQVPGGTGEAYFVITHDGSECSVRPDQQPGSALPDPNAALIYRFLGLGPGDLPSGQVWVPSGSPWHLVSPDGGLADQGPGTAVGIGCFASASSAPPITLVDSRGDTVVMRLDCSKGGGAVFEVSTLSFTSGPDVDGSAG